MPHTGRTHRAQRSRLAYSLPSCVSRPSCEGIVPLSPILSKCLRGEARAHTQAQKAAPRNSRKPRRSSQAVLTQCSTTPHARCPAPHVAHISPKARPRTTYTCTFLHTRQRLLPSPISPHCTRLQTASPSIEPADPPAHSARDYSPRGSTNAPPPVRNRAAGGPPSPSTNAPRPCH